MAKKQKVHSLTGRITERLMSEAFKAVKRNRGAAGIDKVSIGMFEKTSRPSGFTHERLEDERYLRPQAPASSVDSQRSQELSSRPLGIPAVRDRVAQK